MAFEVLWKPQSQGSLNTGGLSFLVPANRGYRSAQILDAEGNVVDNLKFSRAGAHETNSYKFYSNRPGGSYGQNLQVRTVLDDGSERTFSIPNGAARYEGGFDDSDLAEVAGGSSGGFGGQFPASTSPGGFSAIPYYLGDQFPNPFLVDFDPARRAQAKFVDPTEFAQEFGDANREQIQENAKLSSDLAKQFSLDFLQTEQDYLADYLPQQAALKRSLIDEDNIFNQGQRDRQVDTALPGVREDLEGQRSRANAYAEGRLPDSVQDRALELGVRSRAADSATAGGFGPTSQVSRKASDLLSAESRLQLSQYGDQLLTSNIGTRSNLLLAPTQYSNAGQQVNVNPSIMPAQLANSLYQNAFGQTNQSTILSPGQALGSEVGQRQFNTNLRQQTRQFNAQGLFNESQVNAGVQNQFALGQFQYDVGYAGAVAGAHQNDINTAFQISQQQLQREIFEQNRADTQAANQAGAEAGAIATGAAIIPQIIDSVTQIIESVTGDGSSTGSSSGSPDVSVDTPDLQGDESISGPDEVPDGNVGVQSTVQPDGSPGVVSVPSDSVSPIESSPDVVVGPEGPSVQTPVTGDVPVTEGATTGELAFSRIADNAEVANAIVNPETPASKQARSQSGAALRAAGVYTEPVEGSVRAGVNRSGENIHADPDLASNQDTRAGGVVIDAIKKVLDPMGVLGDDDASLLDQIRTVSTDAAFISQLTALAQRGDTEGFINSVLGKFQKPLLESIKDPNDRAGVAGAYTAYQLYNNWDNMSEAQRALGLATLGMQGYKYGTGENLAAKQIISPSGNTPGLNVGEALGLLQQGYNVYTMIDNWDSLSDIQKVVYGTNSVANMAQMAEHFGFLGHGLEGSAVAGVNSAALAQAGFTAAPEFGVGAVIGSAESALPQGYEAIASTVDGQVVGIPSATSNTATVIGQAAGVAGIALGAKTIYDNWGAGGGEGAATGALGAISMAAGINSLGYALGPWGWGAMIAVGALSGYFGSGKGEDQVARDGVRSWMRDAGFVNGDWQVKLADGSFADVGSDFGSGSHGIKDSSLFDNVGDDSSRDLEAWELDYTNDLDYAAHMGTSTLMRMLSGGTKQATEQFGAQLANAALGNVGFGKDMNPESFQKVAANVRSFYAQNGIKSKEDAWALANVMYSEGRIDVTQLTQMHQSLNMFFNDDGYQLAQQLMEGRWRGIDVVKEKGNSGNNQPSSREQAIQRNRASFGAAA